MTYKNNFSVFSHNVRSLSNKWDDFKQILNDFLTGNFKFSAICLQEIWSLNPVFKFALEGYSPLYSKLRSRNPDGQTGEGDDEGIRGERGEG